MKTTDIETSSIHLQSIGRCAAKPAAQLAMGDVTVWNFGYRYLVRAVRAVSKCFIEVDMVAEGTGAVWTRKFKIDRLVAVSSSPWTGA